MFSDLLTAELGTPIDIGDEYRYNCPFCESNDKHKLYLHVAEDDKENLWHCFKCGERGNPISFVMKYFQVNFNDSLDILEGFDYTFDNRNFVPKDESLTDEEYILLMMANKQEEQKKPEEHFVPPALPEGFKLLADNIRNPEAYPFLLYAHSRGFTFDDIYLHNMGYVVHSTVPLANGKEIHLHNHLIFITHGDDGKMQYWNTRAIGESYVKAFNAPSRDHEYSKRNVVFNLNRAKRTPFIVINEGVPDAIAVGESGVGTFGKQVTNEQIHLITKDLAPTQKIYIFLDNDAKNEIKKLAEKLFQVHEETYIVLNPTNDDANKLGHVKAWEVINNHSVKADGLGIIQLML